MIEITYRVPGTMTMRETDTYADALDWLDGIAADPAATLISVNFNDNPED